MSKMKLASVVVAMLLFFAAVSGTGYALADDSLPGEPLYGLKGAFEQARVNLTRSPEAKAELAVDLAERRMEEVATMLQNGQTVEFDVARQAREQLTTAEQAMGRLDGSEKEAYLARYQHMYQWAYQRMGSLIENRPPEEAGAVPQLLRSMTATQYQYQGGEGTDPSGTQTQTGPGGPPDAADMPEPGSQLNALGPNGPFGLDAEETGYGPGPYYGPGHTEDGDREPPKGDTEPIANEGTDGAYGPGQPPADAPLGPNPDPSGSGLGDQNKGPQNGSGGTNGSGDNSGGTNGGGDSSGGSSGGGGH